MCCPSWKNPALRVRRRRVQPCKLAPVHKQLGTFWLINITQKGIFLPCIFLLQFYYSRPFNLCITKLNAPYFLSLSCIVVNWFAITTGYCNCDHHYCWISPRVPHTVGMVTSPPRVRKVASISLQMRAVTGRFDCLNGKGGEFSRLWIWTSLHLHRDASAGLGCSPAPVALPAAEIMGWPWVAEMPCQIERMLCLQKGSYFAKFFIIIRKWEESLELWALLTLLCGKITLWPW